jgi:maleylpyruvate isomerase
MEGTRSAQGALRRTLGAITDAQVAEPSSLPDWTRGHVLTHIARNADSHVRLLTAAARGERVEQYAGGSEGRAADIEAGAARSAPELVADVERSAQQLFDVWDDMPQRIWDEEVVGRHKPHPAWVLVFSRWRETEIHHVDLELGYTSEEWPVEFTAATLNDLVESLGPRLPGGVDVDLVAPDIGFKASAGRGDGSPLVIEGPARTMLAWLAGRPFDRDALRTENGALPDVGPWI